MGSLYEQDLVLWSEQQARELRAAAGASWNAPIDWEDVAEEIESLGRSERRALASHIGTVIEHLLKLEVASSIEPVRGWRDTIRRARSHRAGRTNSSRSLVRASLDDYGEKPRVDLDTLAYKDEQVVGDWFPDVK